MNGKPPSWGVMRYAPGREGNSTHHDGWYLDRREARVIYLDWQERFTAKDGWIVVLVRADESSIEEL